MSEKVVKLAPPNADRSGVSSSIEAVNLAKAENLRISSRLLLIKEQERLGELIPVDTVAAALARVASETAAIIDTIPAILRQACKKLTNQDLKIIRRELDNAMTTMSQIEITDKDAESGLGKNEDFD